MQSKLNKLVYLGTILIFLITTAGIGLADDVTANFVSHFGGNAYDIAVVGNYAYFGQGEDLVVMDITDVNKPIEKGRIITSSVVRSVVVSGNYAYVVNGDGLVIIDITNPSLLKLMNTCDIDGFPQDVAISGNYSYVVSRAYLKGEYHDTLKIVDVSNPALPTITGSYDTVGYANSVAVAGNYAYVSDSHKGLIILNITNPSAPALVSTYDTEVSWKVTISGNYAYVASDWNGLEILDIKNPSTPKLVGTYSTLGMASDVAVVNNYAYVISSVYMVDSYHDMLEIVDISNVTAPTPMSTYYGDDKHSANSVAVSGSYAYIADDYGGFVAVDVTDPSSPKLAGKYDSAGTVFDVAVSGNYAYLAESGNGLVIADISNKLLPTFVGSYDTKGYDEAYAVDVSGNYAYLATSYFSNYKTLQIVNISDPSIPTIAAKWDFDQDGHGIAVAKKIAYIANYDKIDIVNVDMTKPSSPSLVGSIPVYAHDIAASGNYAYVYTEYEGFVILNATNPSSPRIEGNYNVSGNIAISDNYAYVANGNNGLVILNVSDPSSPKLAGIYHGVSASDVAISGNYAYVTGESGLSIIDITNHASPTLAGSYSTVGNSVTVAGDYVYVADGDRGLTILRVEKSKNTALPTSITNLKETGVDTNWINWTWTNPTSTDFSHVIVHIDGKFVTNTSKEYYNLTGLAEGTTHTISTKTVFVSGNINNTWVNDSEKTALSVDTTAPKSVTNLKEESVGPSWINWTWTNPTNVDFSHVMVYVDNEFVANTSNAYYNSSGLAESTTHVISTKTVDMSGNVNSKWMNDSAKTTLSTNTTPSTLPKISELSGKNISSNSITLMWNSSPDVYIIEIHRNSVIVGNVSGSLSYIDGGLASSTAYNYTLIPHSKDGVEGKAVSVVLNTDSSSSSSGGSTTGSSGGSSASKSSSSGGSGGAASTENFANVEMKDVDSEYLKMDANVTYQFTKEGNPIQSISFYSLKNSGEITSTIEVLNNRSKLVSSTPEGSIYKYVNIWVGKAGFATADNIKNPQIKFEVDSSWIQHMGISPEDVKLQRYNGKAWEVLPTVLKSNTTGYIYEAQTSGFSPFAITAEKALASPANGDTDGQSGVNSNVTSPTKENKTPGFEVLFALAGILAVAYLFRKN